MESYELASRIISDVPSAEGQVEPSDEDMPDEAEVQRLLQEAEKLRKESEDSERQRRADIEKQTQEKIRQEVVQATEEQIKAEHAQVTL